MNYQTLRNKEEVPPGGFRYFQKETEHWIAASCWTELITKVKAHRKANELPIGLLIEQEIETQLCSTLPPGSCHYQDEEQRRRASQVSRQTLEKVAELTTLFGQRVKGEAHVSQEEANAHAATCAKCYFNQQPLGCTSCNSGLLNSAIAFVMGTSKRTTKHDSKLKACILCGCSLKSKVHFSAEAIRKGADYLSVLPSWCWLKEGEKQ